MKTTSLLLFLFLLTSFTTLPDTWQKATLRKEVSVELPTLPPLEKAQGVEGYRVHNGRTAFVASVADLMVPKDQKITAYDAQVILMGAEMVP